MSEINTALTEIDLIDDLQMWAKSFGFQQLGISDIDLEQAGESLNEWVNAGFHGDMDYMVRHGSMRTHPEQLVPGTIRVISVRMDYLPEQTTESWRVLNDDNKGFVSRYALGRDYHKLMRKRLQKLAQKIEAEITDMGFRVFCDSAPVMEKALAQKAGLGWVGKHSNILNREHGSYFFLGEIYTDLPLPVTEPTKAHCGSCAACIDICPTKAIVLPYQVDARRCISYLSIELRDAIPVEFRSMMGNRIYGCDDCQLVCPWNKFAHITQENDFLPKHGLDAPDLLELFAWTEQEFLTKLEGSPIRRIGYECWLRNIAVALGNAKCSYEIVSALTRRLSACTDMVKEHIEWALIQQAKHY
ncbi:MAG: tRNA epoxyqueuosine(34) reductase QueG [Gammaproteobacteria bacterium]|nr:tRNA epoxyqueuosine(34) reductase QueG [Gammaproteobacteria bacterium]